MPYSIDMSPACPPELCRYMYLADLADIVGQVKGHLAGLAVAAAAECEEEREREFLGKRTRKKTQTKDDAHTRVLLLPL